MHTNAQILSQLCSFTFLTLNSELPFSLPSPLSSTCIWPEPGGKSNPDSSVSFLYHLLAIQSPPSRRSHWIWLFPTTGVISFTCCLIGVSARVSVDFITFIFQQQLASTAACLHNLTSRKCHSLSSCWLLSTIPAKDPAGRLLRIAKLTVRTTVPKREPFYSLRS